MMMAGYLVDKLASDLVELSADLKAYELVGNWVG